MSDDESRLITREEKVMKSFLEGKLHLGSSLTIVHYGHPISFTLKGKNDAKLKKWWKSKGVHPNQRTMHAHLIIYDKPYDCLPQLSRDLDYRVEPYNKVQIVLTPAELHDNQGKVKTSSVKEHKNIIGAPKFSLHDVDRSVGHMNLLRFVAQTLELKKDLDEVEAERKRNWRPFITPIRQEPVPARFVLPGDVLEQWSSEDQDSKEPDPMILAEADRVAERAIKLHQSQLSLKDGPL